MYIHLGNDVVVSESSVVGIFDIENTSISKETKEYLAAAQKNGNIVYVTDELPKSFVVCREKEKNTVYICQVSPATILKRAEANEIEIQKIRELVLEKEED